MPIAPIRVVFSILAILLLTLASLPYCLATDVGPTPEQILSSEGIATTVPALSAALGNQNLEPDIRYYAAVVLGKTGGTSAVPALLAALDDDDEDVRIGGLTGLRYVGSESAVPDIGKVLESDASSGVRGSAVAALKRIGGGEAGRYLVATAINEKEVEQVRLSSLLALASPEVVVSTTELEPLLRNSNPAIRMGSAVAMGVRGDRRAVPILVSTALDPKSKEVTRFLSVRALTYATGTDFSYISSTGRPVDAQQRAEALREIETWWESAKTAYQNQDEY